MKPGALQFWDAVDPGVDYFARAGFRGATLSDCGMRHISVGLSTREGGLVVVEMPQIYKYGKARKSDIANLIFSAGRVADRYEDHVLYLPAEWKGQVPKKIHHARVEAALSPAEKALLPKKKGELKHVLDAIGVGLHHLAVHGMREPI